MKRLIAAILTVVLMCAVFLSFTAVLKSRSQEAKYADYFNAPERYDIVFLGSSHVIMGTLPLELWKEHGLSSYNLANYNQPIQTDYWLLRFVLEKHKPELVVVDAYPVFVDSVFSDANSEMMHGLFEQLPFSKLKQEAIEDMFSEDIKEEYTFPLSYYHSRWTDIDKSSFSAPKENYFYGQGSDESAFYGTPSSLIIRPYEGEGPIDSREIDRSETVAKTYLRRIIELCRDTDTKLLLTMTPFLAYDDEMRWVNSVCEIAEEYGVPLFSGLGAGIIDPKTDMFDYGHLNSSGARKWTAALGRYLIENYELPIYTQGKTADFWDEEYYGKYIPYKNNRISSQNTLYNYLMLCADKNLSVALYIPAGSEVFSDSESMDLIRNLSPVELTELSSCGAEGKEYFCFIDHPRGKVTEAAEKAIIPDADSSFGEIAFRDSVLYRNGEQIADWKDYSPNGVNRIRFGIAVFDNYSGNLMNTKWFYRAESGTYISIN